MDLNSNMAQKADHSVEIQEEQKVYAPPPIVTSGLKCSQHINNLVHSYLNQKIKVSKLGTYQHSLLCTQCIFDRNLNSTQVEIIPGVMHEVKQRM